MAQARHVCSYGHTNFGECQEISSQAFQLPTLCLRCNIAFHRCCICFSLFLVRTYDKFPAFKTSMLPFRNLLIPHCYYFLAVGIFLQYAGKRGRALAKFGEHARYADMPFHAGWECSSLCTPSCLLVRNSALVKRSVLGQSLPSFNCALTSLVADGSLFQTRQAERSPADRHFLQGLEFHKSGQRA
jgi:hypothetical protein